MRTPLQRPSTYFGLSLLLTAACGLDPVPSQGSQATTSAGATTRPEASTSSSGDEDATDSTQESPAETSSEGPESTEETSSEESTESTSSESTSSDSSTEDTDQDSGQEPGKIDCDTLKFSGFDPGQVPKAVSLTDSEGKPVQLRDACNETVVVISGDST